MVRIKDAWLDILSKYRASRLTALEARNNIVNDLFAMIKIRELAITQLYEEHSDEAQAMFTGALKARMEAMPIREDELSCFTEHMHSLTVSMAVASLNVKKLEENLQLYEELAESNTEIGDVPAFTLIS